MRVAIDARSVMPQMRGTGRYALNLLQGLSQTSSDLEFLVFYNHIYPIMVLERLGGPYRGRLHWIQTKSAPHSAYEKIELPWLLRINNAKLFHNINGVDIWSAGIPQIVTAHELNDHNERAIRKARLIIAVSQVLQDEIEEKLNVSRPKIRVIPNAVDPWFYKKVSQEEIKTMREHFKLNDPYFLCVTDDRPSKNLDLIRKVLQEWPGNERWVFTSAANNALANNPKVLHVGVVEDIWLRSLYAACKALIIPSKYEGFSLPPIECLATGSLPVVSKIAAHEELLGGVLNEKMFFDPDSSTNANSLQSSLQAIDEGGEFLHTSVLEKFKQVSDRYSTLSTTEAIQSVYREGVH